MDEFIERRSILRLTASLPACGLLGILGDSVFGSAALAAESRPAVSRPRLILLDPGHGGADPGAVGAKGTLEKDVTLHIAQEAARLLSGKQGIGVRLTRRDDRFLALEERVAIARKTGADLFVSIHADSAPNADARGLSAYTLSSRASDGFASRLAQQENRADRFGGIDPREGRKVVRDILHDLTARHTRNASLVARQALVRGAGRDLQLLENPMRSANFAVLKAPDVPSVLVETGFLSNPADEAVLRDPRARGAVARVLARELAAVVARSPFI